MPRVPNKERDYAKRLGAAIVELRGIRQISQATLAGMIERSEPTLSRWELGKSQPSAHDLMLLCEALDVPAEILVFPPEVTEKPMGPVAARLAMLTIEEVTLSPEDEEAVRRTVRAARLEQSEIPRDGTPNGRRRR